MASKIILFLSTFNSRSTENTYTCPDGSAVLGTQTNDAPVRYLLQAHHNVQKIICVVTTQARETIWDYFQNIVREAAPKAEIISVQYEEDENFSEKAIPAVLEHTQSDDDIFLDVTGGFRNANMYLLLLSRVLSYKGIHTAGAVYSNFQTKTVEDISHLIKLFDLVGGMQELTSFGNVRTLRSYYDQQARRNPPGSKTITNLLSSMERLTETITLCRTRQIEERLNQFNAALTDAENCEDPLMRTLLPVFREKFGRKMTIPGLIKWCVENGMIQQALTIYKERIPTYLIRDRKDILEVKSGAAGLENANAYQNEDEAWFYEYLLPSLKSRSSLELDADTLYTYFEPKCSILKLKEILMDYLYIRALRNMIHHANDSSTESQKRIEEYLFHESPQYKRLENVKLEDVKKALLTGLDHLKISNRRGKRK